MIKFMSFCPPAINFMSILSANFQLHVHLSASYQLYGHGVSHGDTLLTQRNQTVVSDLCRASAPQAFAHAHNFPVCFTESQAHSCGQLRIAPPGAQVDGPLFWLCRSLRRFW